MLKGLVKKTGHQRWYCSERI